MIGPNQETNQKHFIGLLVLTIMFVSLPFFVVRFIPSTDLPQHLAQIRLFQEILSNPHQEEYSINFTGANSLVYFLIGLHWIVFDPVTTGKAVVLELALLWVISIFALARLKNRSPSMAILASVFIFNLNLYWGFLNFLIGWPIYILWYVFVIDNQKLQSAKKSFMLVIGLSALLFFAHTLWLIAGLVLLLLGNIFHKRDFRQWIIQACGLVPIGIWSASWFPKFAAARSQLNFDIAPHWYASPLDRLQPQWLLNSVLGGLRGFTEAILCGGIILWIVLSLKTNWGHNKKLIEKDFLYTGVFLFLVILLAPEKYLNTIYFAQRWGALAIIFILLSIPAPRMPEPILIACPMFLLVAFSLVTSYHWYQFETTENTGLKECLDRIPDNAKILGLDFVKESKFIEGRPFLQIFAYAQALHGGSLNFSFAEHQNGIVTFGKPNVERRWSSGLEWYPERVRPRDVQQFDFTLIHGTEFLHNFFSAKPELHLLTTEGRWKLYRCLNDTTLKGKN